MCLLCPCLDKLGQHLNDLLQGLLVGLNWGHIDLLVLMKILGLLGFLGLLLLWHGLLGTLVFVPAPVLTTPALVFLIVSTLSHSVDVHLLAVVHQIVLAVEGLSTSSAGELW